MLRIGYDRTGNLGDVSGIAAPVSSLSSGCQAELHLLKGAWASPPAKEDAPMRQFLVNILAGVLATVIGGWILIQLVK